MIRKITFSITLFCLMFIYNLNVNAQEVKTATTTNKKIQVQEKKTSLMKTPNSSKKFKGITKKHKANSNSLTIHQALRIEKTDKSKQSPKIKTK